MSVRAEATALPFRDSSFNSIALLYVLYHLVEPTGALVEAHRLLRPGGLLALAAPSRYDSPELTHALPRSLPTIDAELAEQLLPNLFADVEVERWDGPLLEIPSRVAVRDYLLGKGVELEQAWDASEVADVPLRVTKRGALAFAWKSRE